MNGTTKSSTNNKPAVSSPLAAYDPEPEVQILFRIITPVTIEEEEGDFVEAGFDGLPQGELEDTIRQFHSVAANADIELRRNLLALRAEHLQKRKRLIEQHRLAMEMSARDVAEGWKAARAAEKERRLNGGKRSTINGYDRRSASTTHTPTLSQTSEMFPGKKSAMKNGNGKKSAMTFDDDPPDFAPDRTASPFATPIDESAPNGQSWGWPSATQTKAPTARMSNGNNLWARDAPTPPPKTTTQSRTTTSSAAQAAWTMKKPTNGKTTTNGRTVHATVEDADSGDEEDEEEEILVDHFGHEPTPAVAPPHTSSSWGWPRNDPNPSLSRGNTPKPPDVRPRAMSNAKSSSLWGDTANGGGGYRASSSFGGGLNGGGSTASDPRFETWRPGAGISSSPGDDVGRGMVDFAMQKLTQARGEVDLESAMRMYTSGVDMNRKRTTASAARR